ncbi:MAG: hypothetical protein ACE5FZ_06330 [Nitrospiria bacterium]
MGETEETKEKSDRVCSGNAAAKGQKESQTPEQRSEILNKAGKARPYFSDKLS